MTNRVTLVALATGLCLASASYALGQTTTTYTYDALGRLATSKSSASTLQTTYGYDLANNRSQVTVAVPGSGGGTVAPPTCANNSGTITANQPNSTVSTTFSVLSQCTDSAGNALSLSSWSVTGKGSGVINPTSSTTINLTLSVGTTYVNFTVSDGKGNTASGTFTFNRTS
jgi:DnaJ-class molecular chaperone